MRYYLLLILVLILSFHQIHAQSLGREKRPLPQQYTAYATSTTIIPDGYLNEKTWKDIPWSSLFVDIQASNNKQPTYTTQFKLCWDTTNLYIAAILEEPHIWASLQQHDTILFHDNVFELFIDPDGDAQNYFEIEINAFKTIFDLFMNKPYKSGGKSFIGWNVQNMVVGIAVDGTLNNGRDKDKKWIIEIQLPFKSLAINNEYSKPADGTVWRMNFCRAQWKADFNNGIYTRKKDQNGKLIPKENWVWSPQASATMHEPEYWGYIKFSISK